MGKPNAKAKFNQEIFERQARRKSKRIRKLEDALRGIDELTQPCTCVPCVRIRQAVAEGLSSAVDAKAD